MNAPARGTPEILDDELLRYIATGLQLTPSQYEKAVSAYSAVARYFADPQSPFAAYGPDIYPQGSMATGTTVRPVRGNEFDLDVLLQLRADHRAVKPMLLLQTTFKYLRAHPEFGPIAELRGRCVRLSFAGDFHLDVVPACLDLSRGPTGIQIPDAAIAGWKPSNPKAFLTWFKTQAGRRVGFQKTHVLSGTVEPAPGHSSPDTTTPLQFALQFLKRNRDIHFLEMPDCAPPSILLTTLTGSFYSGEASVGLALVELTLSLAQYVFSTHEAPVLLNPGDDKEIISEKWLESPKSWDAFRSWARNPKQILSTLAHGDHLRVLEAMLGKKAVDDGVRLQAEHLARARERGGLSVSAQGGLVVAAGSQNVTVRPHHFYGQ